MRFFGLNGYKWHKKYLFFDKNDYVEKPCLSLFWDIIVRNESLKKCVWREKLKIFQHKNKLFHFVFAIYLYQGKRKQSDLYTYRINLVINYMLMTILSFIMTTIMFVAWLSAALRQLADKWLERNTPKRW